jgi:predicted enzyme related to lactoylglutathione lyase
MAQPSVHGRFIWQELMTADTAAAGAFYARLLGWHTQPYPGPESAYSTFSTDRGRVGGLSGLAQDARAAGARSHWLPFIGTDDVDATVAAAQRLGGKVLHSPADIDNVGRYAILADPQGATFGAYRPQRPQASPARGEAAPPGEFVWHELATSDHEAAFDFYRELFGWEALQRMDMGPAGTYLIFGRDGVRYGGLYRLSTDTPVPYWLSYIQTADVDTVAAAATAAGGKVVNGPMEVPGGARIAQLLDPNGVLFAVHAEAKAKAKAAAPARAPARTRRVAAPAAAPAPRRPAAAKSPARKTAAKKKRQSARKAAAKKTAVKKTAGRRAAVKRAARKKTVAKKAPAKTAAARRPAPKKKARRTTRKAAAKRTAARSSRGARRRTGPRASGRARSKAPVRAAKRPAARRKVRRRGR